MDYDISQKDRKLQDNQRTIDTQRKAIQELQVYMAMIRQAAQIRFSGISCLIGKDFLQSKWQKKLDSSYICDVVSNLNKFLNGIQDLCLSLNDQIKFHVLFYHTLRRIYHNCSVSFETDKNCTLHPLVLLLFLIGVVGAEYVTLSSILLFVFS